VTYRPESAVNGADPHAGPLDRLLAAGRRVILPIGIFSMAFNILGLAVPLYTMQIYDRVLTGGSRETLLYLVLITAAALAAAAALDMLRSEIAVRMGGWLERRIAPEAFVRAIEARLRGRPYAAEALGDLGKLRGFVAGPTPFTLCDALWTPVYLAIVFLLHPWLGLVALIGVVLLTVLGAANERATRAPLETANTLAMRGARRLEIALRNAEVVIGMGLARAVTRRWMAGHARSLEGQLQASRRATRLLAVTRAVRQLLQVGILGVGALLVLSQLVSPGALIAASIIMSRALSPVEQAVATWKQVIGARAARRRLAEFFAEPVLPRSGMAMPVRGRVRLEAVSLTPPDADAPVLRDVTAVAEPGEALAVLGPAGSGKSSLARLMVGAAQPSSGIVRLDDSDMAAWPRAELGPHIGFLPQNPELFAGTVRDNIARLTAAGDEDVVRAAQLVGAHRMILRLPKGYLTEVGAGGERLSAGQRQWVALARAVFGAPKLVVLDEPSANLDAMAERALAGAVQALKRTGATVVVVSHRPALLGQADNVLRLADGGVEHFGPREEVLRALADARPEPPLHLVNGKREAAQ
jgi:ATP-binding cassette subfamily C protein/ATP-binding cassette subfamily C protein EexD